MVVPSGKVPASAFTDTVMPVVSSFCSKDISSMLAGASVATGEETGSAVSGRTVLAADGSGAAVSGIKVLIADGSGAAVQAGDSEGCVLSEGAGVISVTA